MKSKLFINSQTQSKLKKDALRSGSIVVLARIINAIINIGGTMFLARILTPHDFGLVAMVVSITGIFMVFRDLGLEDATIQQKEITHQQISTLFWVNIGYGFGAYLVLIGISPLLAKVFNEPKVTLITIIFSLGFVFTGASIQQFALMKRNMQFSKIAGIEIFANIASTGLAVFLALKGIGYWAAVIRPLSLNFILSLCAWIFCGWIPGRPVRGSGVLPLIKFGANNAGYFLVTWIGYSFDKFLIGMRIGAEQLGLYQKGDYISGFPVNYLALPLYGVGISTLSKLRDNRKKYIRYYLKALDLLAFVGMPMGMFIWSNSKDIVLLLLGPQWNESATIVSIIGFGVCLYILDVTKGWLHTSLGRADRRLKWGIVVGFVRVLALIVGLQWGVKGVAIALTTTIYILIAPSLWYAGRPIQLKISKVFKMIWRYYLAAVLAGITCMVFRDQIEYMATAWVRLTLSCFGFIATFFAILILLYFSVKPITTKYQVFKELTKK